MATKKPKKMTSEQAKMLGLKETKTAFGTAYTTDNSYVSGVPKPTTTTKTSGGGGRSGGGGSTPTPSPTAPTVQMVSTPTGVITEQQNIAKQQQAQRQNQFIAQFKAKQNKPTFQPRQQTQQRQPNQEQIDFQRKVESGEYKAQFVRQGDSPYANLKKVYVDSSGQVVGEEQREVQSSTQPTNIPFIKVKEKFYGGINVIKENPVGKVASGVGTLVTKSEFVNIGGVISAKDIKDTIQTNSVPISKAMDISLLNTIIGKKSSEATINARAFTIRTGAEFIPTTPLDVAIIGTGVGLYSKLPKVIRVGVSAGTTGFGTYGVLNSRLSPEQRVASGIIGGLGGTGLIFETLPYIRTGSYFVKGKIQNKYYSVKEQPLRFQAVELSKTFKNVKPEVYVKEATDVYFKQRGKGVFEKEYGVETAGIYKEITPEMKELALMNKENILKYPKDYFKGLKAKGIIEIPKGWYGKETREVLSHEIIHSKTPRFILGLGERILPYRYQPSEVLAFGLQKKYSRIGFTMRKEFPIGLIYEGSPLKQGRTTNIILPKNSPLVQGGFGRKLGGEKIFLGNNQFLATSQRGLFKVGTDIILEKEFFVTPQEPYLKIPETRVSRLGVESAFESQKNVEIGWGKPLESQIGMSYGSVGRTEGIKRFKIGTGSELEAIKSYGRVTNVKLLGYTSIKGQGVKIFKFDIGKVTGGKLPFKSNRGRTTEGITFISGEGMTSVLGTRTTKTYTTTSTREPIVSTTTLTQKTQSIPITIKDIIKSPTVTTKRNRGGTSPIIETSYPTPPIPIPSIVTGYKNNPRKIPTIPFRWYPTPPRKTPPIINKGFNNLRWKFKSKPKKQTGLFAVSLRRFGKFKVVGYGKTPEQAFDIGKEKASTTLGATFKLDDYKGKPLKIFGFKTKKTKEGTLYIEEPKYRLSKKGEKKEINYWRNLVR